MFNLGVPWWELVVRGIVVYVFLLILLRITGKRQVGQLAPFDLVLLLVLSNAVQNSMSGGDNSLIGGLILAATLIVLNYLVSKATYHSRKFEEFIDGKPEVLVHDGKLYEEVMKHSQITQHELHAALREAGVTNVKDVQYAILENNGHITIMPKSASVGEVKLD
jgi:uncharacterized membrane protein YcaP (DUF421 family)